MDEQAITPNKNQTKCYESKYTNNGISYGLGNKKNSFAMKKKSHAERKTCKEG